MLSPSKTDMKAVSGLFVAWLKAESGREEQQLPDI
jgi:hypothetical protein